MDREHENLRESYRSDPGGSGSRVDGRWRSDDGESGAGTAAYHGRATPFADTADHQECERVSGRCSKHYRSLAVWITAY